MKNKNTFILKALLVIVTLFFVKDTFAQIYWNGAANFNGTSSYLKINHSSSIDLNQKAFAIQFYLKPDNNNEMKYIFHKDDNSHVSSYEGFINNGSFIFRINADNNLSITSPPLNINEWSYIEIKGYYVNGQLNISMVLNNDHVGSFTSSNHISVSSKELIIGSYTGSFLFYSGLLDNFRIWTSNVQTNNEVFNSKYSVLATSSSGKYQGLKLSLTFENRTAGFGDLNRLYDWSANGNNATGYNMTYTEDNNSTSEYLSTNEALRLFDKGDYFAVLHSNHINFTSAYTLQAWVYPDTIFPGSNTIIGKNYNTGYWLGFNQEGKIRFYPKGGQVVVGNKSIKTKEWTHVAVTYDGAVASIYINGELDATFNSVSGFTTNNDSLYIGADRNSTSPAFFFKGYIDEVRLMNYLRTQEELNKEMYISMDWQNVPNQNLNSVIYNFDGYGYSSTSPNPGGRFRGNASFSNPLSSYNEFIPVSPLVRGNGFDYADGFRLKNSHLPFSTIGDNVTAVDSLYVETIASIFDLNILLTLNTSTIFYTNIVLFSPDGDSLELTYGTNPTLHGGRRHMTVVFDDESNTVLFGGNLVAPMGVVKPKSSLNEKFAGKNPKGWWKIKARVTDNNNQGRLYGWGIQINNDILASNGNQNNTEIVEDYKLEQNFPNPFNPSTKISFSLPQNESVKLRVFDITGKEVASLVNGSLQKGQHVVEFNASGLSSGAYFYKLETGSFSDVKKMMLIK